MSGMRVIVRYGVLLLSALAWAGGESEPRAYHGATEKLGSVDFRISCQPSVQAPFDRAVALLHSFQFGPAIEAFDGVLAADPACAVAYWGIALSSWSNPFAGFKSPAQLEQGLAAVNRGKGIVAPTPRESGYLDAVAHLYVDAAHLDQEQRQLAYEEAMARLAAAYPEDVEAQIFYALALAASADDADKSYAKQLQAGAILERLFARYPDHPGLAHYIIHAYDEPALAPRAAEAARRYGQIAPSTPHALHMPSHTFTRIGDWQASIETNRASAAAARIAGQPADELHASDYMVYAYLQAGQDRAAERLVRSALNMFSRFDPAHATGAAPATAAYFAHAAIPARYCLERRAWEEAAKLQPPTSPFQFVNAITYFARGLGAAHLKDAAGAQAAAELLQSIQERLAAQGEDYWAGQIDVQRQAIKALVAYAAGDVEGALSGLRAAADFEDKSELSSITPGPLQPVREMLGEMLLEAGRPVLARQEFDASLRQEPNRFWSMLGAAQAARLSGDRPSAERYLKQLRTLTGQADLNGRARLAEAREAKAR